jgi:UDP-N-acetylglucosamine diphosphorylase/glucosamine-1-phosphate N-acetyltransferase
MANEIRHIILFEDGEVNRLYPLTLTRPVWEILCGTGTLLERLRKRLPEAEVGFWVRDMLVEIVKERFPEIPVNQAPQGDSLLVNGRLVDISVLADLPPSGKGLFQDDVPIVGMIDGKKTMEQFKTGGTAAVIRGLKEGGKVVDSAVINYPWEVVERNEVQIRLDSGSGENDFFSEVDSRAVIHGVEKVQCGVGTHIGPFSMIDAMMGPVIIGNNVTIESHAVLEGPVFVDDKVVVRSFTRIRGGSSIGKGCKVAGEISRSVIHPFTNKQHEGFLGHSVVGSWCNLGAGTTTSNLKNNYSPVKVQVGDQLVDTGSLFVGSIIGDHTTTAIGTMLNTGTVVGVGCNVFGAGFPPRFIPSFQWGGAEGLKQQPIETVIAIIETMMKRREWLLSPSYRKLLEEVYQHTGMHQPLSSS